MTKLTHLQGGDSLFLQCIVAGLLLTPTVNSALPWLQDVQFLLTSLTQNCTLEKIKSVTFAQ